MLSEFDDRARGALDIWTSTVPNSQDGAWDDASRYRHFVNVPGMNLQHFELETDNPLNYPVHVHIESTDQMRDGCARIGQYPDPLYVSQHVINFYLDVKETKRPRIDTISAKMRDKFIIYDRIILPEKTKNIHARWAISISLPRVVLPAHASKPSLTRREHQVLEALIMGNTAKEIALTLGVAPKTVEHRIESTKKKFGARNIQHLVSLAISQRLG